MGTIRDDRKFLQISSSLCVTNIIFAEPTSVQIYKDVFFLFVISFTSKISLMLFHFHPSQCMLVSSFYWLTKSRKSDRTRWQTHEIHSIVWDSYDNGNTSGNHNILHYELHFHNIFHWRLWLISKHRLLKGEKQQKGTLTCKQSSRLSLESYHNKKFNSHKVLL